MRRRAVAAIVAVAVAIMGLSIGLYLVFLREPVVRLTPGAFTPGPTSAESAQPTTTQQRAHRSKRKALTPVARPTPRATRPASAPGGGGATAVEAEAIRLTNVERARKGCGALRTDSRLVKAARAHSADMAAKGYFDHNSPDGRSPFDRMRDAGYTAGAAENIARGYPSAAAVVRGWMDSPGHRANILNCSLKAVGVGAKTGSGGPWWTQDFGTA